MKLKFSVPIFRETREAWRKVHWNTNKHCAKFPMFTFLKSPLEAQREDTVQLIGTYV